MRLVNLFLRKKEHDIKQSVSRSGLLRAELAQLTQTYEAQMHAYHGCRSALPSNGYDAQMQSRYMNSLRSSADALLQQIQSIEDELNEVLQQLKVHHGEKKALETYQKRKRHQLDRIRERKENETAYESFTHRMLMGR